MPCKRGIIVDGYLIVNKILSFIYVKIILIGSPYQCSPKHMSLIKRIIHIKRL